MHPGKHSAGSRLLQSNLDPVRRSRLIIPLAAAAAATYIALVRDDGLIRRRPAVGLAAGEPTPTSDLQGPVMAPPPMPSAPVFTPSAPVSRHLPPPPIAVSEPPRIVAQPTEPAPHASADLAAAASTGTAADSTVSDDVFARHIADATDAPQAAESPQGTPIEWTEMEGIPDLPEADDSHATSSVRALPEGPVLDEGTFSIGGWAAAPGHSVVSAVTYRNRLPAAVDAERIVLQIEMSENIPDEGLLVLSDPGFAPDREGFTLLLSAADPGPFSASGTYRAVG